MPIIFVLLAAIIGWALWSGKLRIQQLLPLLLGIGGAALVLRGNFVIGLGAVAIALAWYRGLTWRLFGLKTRQSDQYVIDNARFLLGVSRFDNAERIRARHRQLINDNHPDRGGSADRAAELNKARDLLLRDLETKSR